MTALEDQTEYLDLANAGDDESLLDDWLGLAGYLAAAVDGGEISIDLAYAELAAEATGPLERRALGRAAEVAASRLGPDSPVAKLLRLSMSLGSPTADVA